MWLEKCFDFSLRYHRLLIFAPLYAFNVKAIYMFAAFGMALIFWDIRGLGDPAKHRIVRDFLIHNNCCIIGLQETNLEKASLDILRSMSGGNNIDSWISCEALGTTGGILVGWRKRRFDIHRYEIERFSVSVHRFDRLLDYGWSFTCVYGPFEHAFKKNYSGLS